ncbi:MAG: DNA polymerase, partial [Pseudomonadales bacterium]
MLWIDFETRSRCDLKTAGVYNYAMDGSTDVLCMSYAFDDEDVVTWTPDQPFPERVRAYTGQIRAHNAAFERLIFWYVLQINYDLEQFYCTAAQARANCAPGSLEDLGRFASADMKKDYRGAQLIRLLSVPQADGTFRQDASLMAEMIAYCEQDVRAMRAVSNALRPLSDEELADYHVSERINDRGVGCDVALCRAAVKYASDELREIEARVGEVTQGEIKTVRSPKMREWVLERVGDEARNLMRVNDKYSIDKSVRANLLAMDNPDEVPPDVAEVIQCADDLWASSVAKFSRLSELADVEDGRVRGAFVFAGGSATGRASSYGAQVHNFTRKVAAEPDDVRQAMVRGHAIVPKYGRRVTDVLRGMLRPALVPAPGHVFVVADWSAIEARMNPWLSAEMTSEAKLDLFRSGEDVYKYNAAATFHVPVAEIDKDQRQIGKVQELACGYAGGVGAFASMGRVYGVRLSETEARRMVDAWRRANPWAVAYWQALESAYTRAMRNPGREFPAGRVVYLFDGQHLWYALP